MKTLTQIYEEKMNPSQPNGFCILKPGFTQYKDEFINLLKANDWKVIDQCTRKLTRPEAEELYRDKKDEPYYQRLCDYMICDDSLCCACHKECADPINDMKELKKKVREQWGEDELRNAMHSSDSQQNVIRECGLCIKECGSKNANEDLQSDVQKELDNIKPNNVSDIDKMTEEGIKSIMRNTKDFDCSIPTQVKDCGDYFLLKYDVNDFLTHNKVSKCIYSVADAFKSSYGSPKVDVDVKKYTLKIWKQSAKINEASLVDLIVVDSDAIICSLKNAFCEEMNAWYQYIIVAPFLKGACKTEVERFYKESADDELTDHGYSILERLNILGADVNDLLSPAAWNTIAAHKFISPMPGYDTETSVIQNIEAEKGAIETYRALEMLTRESDPVTNQMAKHILGDEQEHLNALEELLDTIRMVKN